MTERTTTERQQGNGQPTVIVTDSPRGSGSGWVIAIVLLIALIAGIMFLARGSGSEAAKDNAIANAAGEVGDAAQKVGNAAEDAANKLDQ